MALDLNEKPWYVAAIVGAVVGIGLFVILHVYVFKDIQKNIGKVEVSIDELEREIEKGRAAKANIQKLEEDIANYELELDRLKRILPTRMETDILIKRAKQLTELGHFQLARFTPGTYKDQGFYWEWPIRVLLSGTYHELGLFFDRLSRFSRIINVSNLQIRPVRGSDQGYTITANFTQLTFIWKEQ